MNKPNFNDSSFNQFYQMDFLEGDGAHLITKDSNYICFNCPPLFWLPGFYDPALNQSLLDSAKAYKSGELTPESIHESLLSLVRDEVPDCNMAYYINSRPLYSFYQSIGLKEPDSALLVIGDVPEVTEERACLIDGFKYAKKHLGVKSVQELMEENTLKALFNELKNKLSAVVVTPVLPDGEGFIQSDEAKLLGKLAKKAKIPFLMDERTSFSMRSGELFYFMRLGITPDFILAGGLLYKEHYQYVVFSTKKTVRKRLILDESSLLPQKENLPYVLMLYEIVKRCLDIPLSMRYERVAKRLYFKLKALSANSGGKMSYIGEYAYFLLDFKTNLLRERAIEQLLQYHILVKPYEGDNTSLILRPNFELTVHDVDHMIGALSVLFSQGIQISKQKKTSVSL